VNDIDVKGITRQTAKAQPCDSRLLALTLCVALAPTLAAPNAARRAALSGHTETRSAVGGQGR